MRSLLLALAVLAVPLAAPAQAPGERVSIARFRDSLPGRSGQEIVQLERSLAGAGTDGATLLRLGFTLLHRARQDGRLAGRARDVFRESRDQEPGWPYPLLGIGLSEEARGDWLAAEPLNLGTRVGHGSYRAAAEAFVAALELDPHLAEAAVALDRVATALRDSSVARRARESLRDAVDAGNGEPRVLLSLARREWEAGADRDAAVLFDRYGSSGGTPALAEYELARAGAAGGDGPGFERWIQAASSTDSATSARVRSDLLPIATAEELAELEQADRATRDSLLRHFWELRALRELRQPGERLAEHYRRLRFAHTNFALGNNRRYYGMRDLYRARPGEVLDDRGVVYVRHGEPDQRVVPVMYGLLPSETWHYRRADGDLLLHFSAGGEGVEGGDLGDFRLVASADDLRGANIPVDLLYLELTSLSDLYLKMMNWGPYGAARARREEAEWGIESARTGTGEESHQLKFADSLPVITDLVAIGNTGDGTRLVHLLVALPGGRIGPPEARVRMAFIDSTGMTRHTLDTVTSLQPMGAWRGTRVSVPVSAGVWRARIAIENGDAGIVLPLKDISILPVTRGIGISALALGRERGSLAWARTPGDTALLHPVHEFSRAELLHLYAEVAGLAPGESFVATVSVFDRNRERAGRRRLRLEFAEAGRAPLTAIRRALRLADLRPGDYWLVLEVKSGKGQVTARKGFTVKTVTS